jgi:hypothetical protein
LKKPNTLKYAQDPPEQKIIEHEAIFGKSSTILVANAEYGVCHKSKNNCVIELNINLKKLKHKAHELLKCEQGIEKRKQRCHDVELVYENIKKNHGFRCFMLRSPEKCK